MNELASDWAEWASACDARATQPPAAPVTDFTVTMSIGGRVVDAQRVDVATGDVLLADVVPMRR
ncbi:hypothetical protein [Nocardioides donggukensis]|uniref:Uncharacterized protein n=1 Tax=Nocardioides donggukensis TaxID=2774019 RepID=A0A927K541_9ACTN|nr:hypothetical protein [Nocardioides donggukensis]MBD8869300.1 hypothetical protein [Nocardioides donggukensis]